MGVRRILIADDDEVFLKLVDRDLSKEGYAVLLAKDGEEAITIAKSQTPDLILLDINMPEIGGGEVGDMLKNDPQTQGIPVIFLTGLLTKEEEERMGHTIGGNFFIAKPYNLKGLLQEINKRLK